MTTHVPRVPRAVFLPFLGKVYFVAAFRQSFRTPFAEMDHHVFPRHFEVAYKPGK